jgi:hypothetical protein
MRPRLRTTSENGVFAKLIILGELASYGYAIGERRGAGSVDIVERFVTIADRTAEIIFKLAQVSRQLKCSSGLTAAVTPIWRIGAFETSEYEMFETHRR